MMAQLEHWHDFYLLVGTAGATLLALLFVAVSLGTGFLTEDHAAPTRAFYSPVVIHFTSVFFISAIALVPTHRTIIFAALIGATSLIGTLVSAVVTVQLVRRNWTQYLEDYLAYGLLPAIGYLTLAAAAVMIFTETGYAFEVLAGGLLLLLIVNIRNVWDLMLSMVRRQAARAKRKP
jgi:hypothetical protein